MITHPFVETLTWTTSFRFGLLMIYHWFKGHFFLAWLGLHLSTSASANCAFATGTFRDLINPLAKTPNQWHCADTRHDHTIQLWSWISGTICNCWSNIKIFVGVTKKFAHMHISLLQPQYERSKILGICVSKYSLILTIMLLRSNGEIVCQTTPNDNHSTIQCPQFTP